MHGIRSILAALAALALGSGALIGATATRARADTTLCQYQVAPVSAGRYTVQNNEWDSPAPECVTTNGLADFTVASSAIANATDGAPGGYPSIFAGCHWGDCTHGGLAADPLLVSALGHGRVTSTWSTTHPGAGAYDVAYDIWINQTPATSGAPDGTEVMIWLNHAGQVQPAGRVVASDVQIDGRRYDVWYSSGGAADCVSFDMISPHTGVTSLDIGDIIGYAMRHGYTSPSWYLISVEAGFEIWQGGTGLATRDFSVSLKPATGGGSSPYRRYQLTR